MKECGCGALIVRDFVRMPDVVGPKVRGIVCAWEILWDPVGLERVNWRCVMTVSS